MKMIEAIRHELGSIWQEIKSNPADFIESGGLSLVFPRGSARVAVKHPTSRLYRALEAINTGGFSLITEPKGKTPK